MPYFARFRAFPDKDENENIAESTIRQEDERTQIENKTIADIVNKIVVKKGETVTIREDITVE